MDGEQAEVPNNTGNQAAGVLAQEMRYRQAQFLKMAQDALHAKGNPDWQRQFEHDNAHRQALQRIDHRPQGHGRPYRSSAT